MKKKTGIAIAAAVAVITLGAAAFASAAKTIVTCCSQGQVCCKEKLACCKYWRGNTN